MSETQHTKQLKIKQARLEITASMYKRGNSVRKIREEIMKRLDLEHLSTQTVQKDIQFLLKEWRENRIEDMDLALQLELERIDDTVNELWQQWEKSKQDYTKIANKRKGQPQKVQPHPGSLIRPGGHAPEEIRTFMTEENKTHVIRLGDVSYIAEIRQQLAERRKLLGLYAPGKTELTGKDGKDLMATTPVNLDDFTPEEKAQLLRIARSREQHN